MGAVCAHFLIMRMVFTIRIFVDRFQFIASSVILSELQRVEGSLYRFDRKCYHNAKILRLRASHSAQNDMLGGTFNK